MIILASQARKLRCLLLGFDFDHAQVFLSPCLSCEHVRKGFQKCRLAARNITENLLSGLFFYWCDSYLVPCFRHSCLKSGDEWTTIPGNSRCNLPRLERIFLLCIHEEGALRNAKVVLFDLPNSNEMTNSRVREFELRYEKKKSGD